MVLVTLQEGMALHKGLVTLEDQVGLQEFRLG